MPEAGSSRADLQRRQPGWLDEHRDGACRPGGRASARVAARTLGGARGADSLRHFQARLLVGIICMCAVREDAEQVLAVLRLDLSRVDPHRLHTAVHEDVEELLRVLLGALGGLN